MFPRPRLHWLLIIFFLAQFIGRGELSLRQESTVWDEPMHLHYGLNFWPNALNWPAQDHPYPITSFLTLPLKFSPIEPAQVMTVPGVANQKFDLRNYDHPANLFPARRMNLLLGALGLLIIFLGVSRRFGLSTGLFTLMIGALDPNWLAQARYITTDIAHGLALAAGFFLLSYKEKTKWPWPIILAGLALAVALWSKFSGLILIPSALVIVFFNTPGTVSQRLLGAAKSTAILSVIGGILYLSLFVIPALATNHSLTELFNYLANSFKAFIVEREKQPGVFLGGNFYPRGAFLYFPWLMIAKTTLPIILLIIVLFLNKLGRLTLRSHWPLFVGPVIYLAISIISRMGLGYRHLSPLWPFMWLLGGLGLAAIGGRFKYLMISCLVGLLGLETLLVHPHYLSYSNFILGGPERTYRLAVDSACDWGQDLPTLAKYLEANKPRQGAVHLAYFGKSNPESYGVNALWRPCGKLGRKPWQKIETMPRCEDKAEILAISATCLQGQTMGRAIRDDCYSWLRDQKPTAIIGGSILIYNFK